MLLCLLSLVLLRRLCDTCVALVSRVGSSACSFTSATPISKSRQNVVVSTVEVAVQVMGRSGGSGGEQIGRASCRERV